MGFGSDLFGVSRFGADAIVVSTSQAPLSPPEAALYDLKTKTFLENADGTLVPIDPIDQIVALRMGWALGTIKSAPEIGHLFAKLSRLSDDQLQPAAEKLVADMFADLTANGSISIIEVLTARPSRGNDQVAMVYVNNRTKKPPRKVP